MTAPNIVMIMADQMASDVISAQGHPAVKTPHLDRLVRTGVSFNNCYCNSPLCVPSRASMMAGKLPRDIGVYDNGSEFRASIPTFVHSLRRSGYETILSGKMHFIGPDQLHGFEQRLTKDLHTAGLDLTPDWSQGVYANTGTGVKRLQNPGICDWNSQLVHDENAQFRALEKIHALGRKPEKSPFFLCVSFMHPHDPFVITKEYWDRYEGVHIPMPKVGSESLREMHPYNQWIQTHHEVDQCQLSDEQIRLNRRAYYGMVSYVDDKVGQIMHELERMHLMDNTMIIFVSDHGEMLGEHGMWFKRNYYDPALKVPLIFSWPGRLPAGRQVDQVVSLVDVSATLLELGEVPDAEAWISEMAGASFARLLKTDDSSWKDEAICEYYGEGPIHPMIAVRRGRYKYVYIHREEPLLFDLEQDPHETRNLVHDPEYQQTAADLRARILQNFNPEEAEASVMQSQRERILIAEALRTGQISSWDHVPQG